MGLVSGEENQDMSDDWCVEGSDDEKYDPSKSGKGIWEPTGPQILELFERIEKEKILELKWKCPGRRPPETEEAEDLEATQDPNEEMDKEEPVEEMKPQQPTEFDFDDAAEELKVTPRHTPGSKTPKSQKKVARMDKVLQGLMIQRKQNAAEKEARRLAQGRSPRTPLSGVRGRMSSPGSSPASSPMPTGKSSPGVTPVRPSVGSDMPPIKNITKSIESPRTSSTSETEIKQETSSDVQKIVPDISDKDSKNKTEESVPTAVTESPIT